MGFRAATAPASAFLLAAALLAACGRSAPESAAAHLPEISTNCSLVYMALHNMPIQACIHLHTTFKVYKVAYF